MSERRSFACVWDALEDTQADAAKMRLRSDLMMTVADYIKSKGLNQKEAAKVFGVTQPRISDLIRGRIDLFAVDSLVGMLGTAGMRVELRISKRD